ncbi:uncharacterized protein [Nothobranchius furzeri]|uniref:uncharacterized protein n=1 Tax=Nothobranchius furzeri TaxID=105023 RepID=UPI0039047664
MHIHRSATRGSYEASRQNLVKPKQAPRGKRSRASSEHNINTELIDEDPPTVQQLSSSVALQTQRSADLETANMNKRDLIWILIRPGCRHQLVCREQDGVSLLLPENRRAKDLGRKLVFFWRPLRCFCFNHTRRVSIEERTIEALKNGTQAVISDGEIKTVYKDLCSGRVKSGLMYLWHNPGVSLKLKQRLKPLMFHFADAQVDELTERIGSCSGIDKLMKKGEFQFLDLVFDVLVPEVRGRV